MFTMSEASEYVSLEDAGKLLGKSTRTIRVYIAKGILKGYRFATGRGVQFVKREDVLKLSQIVPIGDDDEGA